VYGCATPLGSGGRRDSLSAGDPSASSWVTLRLLLRVTPLGSGADTACRFWLALLVRTLRPSVPTFGTRFARSDTACRVPTFWVVVYDFLLSLIAKSPYIWGV
jgi:hypothetical protein